MSDEEEGRTKKRIRVSRACDPCRRRKERCDGGQPACQRCTAAARTCFYNPYRKRGLRPGYVRTLEILLGLILHTFDGAEQLILAVLRHKAEDTSTTIGQFGQHRPIAVVSSLLQSWRKSSVLEEVQNPPDSPEAVEDEELYISRLDDNLTSSFNTLCGRTPSSQGWSSMPRIPPLQTRVPEMQSSAPVHPQQLHAKDLTGRNVMTLNQKLASGTPPHLPANWSDLIDLYDRETHNWFPVVPKYTLIRTASLQAKTEVDSNTGLSDTGDLALLWAVLAYSSCRLNATSTESSTSDHAAQSRTGAGSLHAHARHTALQDRSEYDQGYVHANLTLALLDMQDESWLSAWFWVGRAIYMANSIGAVPHGQSHTPTDPARRCFLGCFVLDTLLSRRLGHRPYFQVSDLQLVTGLSDDAPEEWEPWRPFPRREHDNPPGTSQPGHVLSIFNSFCRVTAALLVGDDHGLGPAQIQELNTYFASYDHQSWVGLVQDSPHALQLKMAVSVAYMRNELVSRSTSHTNRTSWEQQQSHVSHGISQLMTLIVNESRGHSMFEAPWLPPTIRIFTYLMRMGTQSMTAQSNHARAPSLDIGLQFPVTLESKPRARPSLPRSVTEATQSSSIDATSYMLRRPQKEASFDQDQHSSSGPQFGMAHDRQPQQLLMPSGVDSRGSGELSLTRLVPVPASSLPARPSDVQQRPLYLGQSSDSAFDRPMESATSDGLFNQLISLDSSDWPTLSEEFMQHLGLPQDGSLIEFQNFLAPHDPES
ncbi:hypothetical protein CC79DRAFT_205007 [Sarocladium strictum]